MLLQINSKVGQYYIDHDITIHNVTGMCCCGKLLFYNQKKLVLKIRKIMLVFIVAMATVSFIWTAHIRIKDFAKDIQIYFFQIWVLISSQTLHMCSKYMAGNKYQLHMCRKCTYISNVQEMHIYFTCGRNAHALHMY